MKHLIIEIGISEDKQATFLKVKGYSKDSLSDQLEIIGILENIKQQQLDKIKTMAQKSINTKKD